MAEAVGRAAGVQTTKPAPKPAAKTKAAYDDECKKPVVVQRVTVTGADHKPRTIIFSEACCVPGGHTLVAGLDAIKDPSEQTHMRPLIDAVKNGPLLEYCVFAFGLNETQAKSLQTSFKNFR